MQSPTSDPAQIAAHLRALGLPAFDLALPDVLAFLGAKETAATIPVQKLKTMNAGNSPCLHLNLGVAGIEEPDDPIEEGGEWLVIAAVNRHPTITVIISGELVRAVKEGLIAAAELADFEKGYLIPA